jgi:hypothetical protein
MATNIWHVLGNSAWIVAMALIASMSLGAWKKIKLGAEVPVTFGRDGKPNWRASRGTAFGLRVGWPFLVGAVLMAMDRFNKDTNIVLLSFGMRVFLASIFPLVHLTWLKAAMNVLDEEGQLEP